MFLAGSITHVKGYPMMIEIWEDFDRCVRLNIPEDDDAHVVFLVLPSQDFHDGEEEDKDPHWIKNYRNLESHYMGQMAELTKRRTKSAGLLRKFPGRPSAEVQQSVDSFLEGFENNSLKSGVTVTLTNPKDTNSRKMDTYWFTPLVVNHIRRAIRATKKDRESSPLEGYMACFANDNDENVFVVIDSVLVEEGPGYDDDDEEDSEDPSFQKNHLTPLAKQLDESARAARTVITEMQYMERRESRMRHTADSINKRVRYFSYISIAILLIVTYLQVTYLKRYFRKKKLL